jgi:HAD superfamily hydrolase (TIGR01509 family)
VIKAILFDLYETLISEYKDGVRKANRSSFNYEQRLGIPDDVYRKEWGARREQRMTGHYPDYPSVLIDILNQYQLQTDKGQIEALYKERIEEKRAAFTDIDPEIIQMLESLKRVGLKLALVSNASEEEVRAWETSPLIAFFDTVVFSYEAGLAKPDRRIYELACLRLCVPAEESLFVGDGGSNELVGAQLAGLTAYQAGWFVPDSILVKVEGVHVMEKPKDLLKAVTTGLTRKDKPYVQEQYKTSNNLDIRIQLHELYSTNPKDWHHWVFEQMDFQPHDRILELGCGNGTLWKKNTIGPSWTIILTDLSEGMLESAKSNLANHVNIQYEIQDIQALSFENESFDKVVANHMLYHVPDRERAFQEIKRILKPEGVLYAATNGEKHMQEMYEWVEEFDATIPFRNKTRLFEFRLDGGHEQLEPHFTSIDKICYESNLRISNPQHLLEYICSVEPAVASCFTESRKNAFIAFLESKKDKEGYLPVTKETGIFICRK